MDRKRCGPGCLCVYRTFHERDVFMCSFSLWSALSAHHLAVNLPLLQSVVASTTGIGSATKTKSSQYRERSGERAESGVVKPPLVSGQNRTSGRDSVCDAARQWPASPFALCGSLDPTCAAPYGQDGCLSALTHAKVLI